MEKDWEPLQEVYCVKCGKAFFPTSVHVYKDSKGKYCSWTCFNHKDDGKVPKYKRVECLYPGTMEIVQTFQSATKAAEWIGTSPYVIARACRNGTKSKGYLWRYKE